MAFTYYGLAFLVFLVLDGIWLVVISKKFYDDQLGYLRSKKTNFVAAIIFYLIFIGGCVYFVLLPNQDKSWTSVFSAGALFGLVTYGTYDLTNLATLRDWPIKVTLIDLTWGTVATATACTLAWLIASWL